MAPGTAPARRPAGWAFPASLVATALIAGGAGAGIALFVTHSSTSVPKAVGLPGTATGTSGAGGMTGLDVGAIAARVDQATVDITAVGPQIGQDAGTGMVISRSGLVLTNNHVIEGSTQISAQINGSGPMFSASVLGTSPSADVALLQLYGSKHWIAVAIGTSRPPAVGDQVIAVGNALDLPGPETVTSGIISGIGRTVTIDDPLSGAQENLSGMLQTSAAISSGNSGGPLVNSRGQVIGMTTAAASSTEPGETAPDVGFAIPVSTALDIAHQVETGKPSASVDIGPAAATGLALTTVACADGFDGCLPLGFGESDEAPIGGLGIYQAPISTGAVVAGVDEGSPAAGSGLRVGDVITNFDGHVVTSPEQVTALVATLKVGDEVTVTWVGQNGTHQSGRFQLVQGPNL